MDFNDFKRALERGEMPPELIKQVSVMARKVPRGCFSPSSLCALTTPYGLAVDATMTKASWKTLKGGLMTLPTAAVQGLRAELKEWIGTLPKGIETELPPDRDLPSVGRHEKIVKAATLLVEAQREDAERMLVRLDQIISQKNGGPITLPEELDD